MGGYGSGRSGGRPTVEDSLTLNLPRLFKTGWLKPGARTSGTLRWSVVGTGEETASMGYIRLHWTSTNRRSGETRQCENRIGLTTTPQPFGGRRWWFVCPRASLPPAAPELPPSILPLRANRLLNLANCSSVGVGMTGDGTAQVLPTVTGFAAKQAIAVLRGAGRPARCWDPFLCRVRREGSRRRAEAL